MSPQSDQGEYTVDDIQKFLGRILLGFLVFVLASRLLLPHLAWGWSMGAMILAAGTGVLSLVLGIGVLVARLTQGPRSVVGGLLGRACIMLAAMLYFFSVFATTLPDPHLESIANNANSLVRGLPAIDEVESTPLLSDSEVRRLKLEVFPLADRHLKARVVVAYINGALPQWYWNVPECRRASAAEQADVILYVPKQSISEGKYGQNHAIVTVVDLHDGAMRHGTFRVDGIPGVYKTYTVHTVHQVGAAKYENTRPEVETLKPGIDAVDVFVTRTCQLNKVCVARTTDRGWWMPERYFVHQFVLWRSWDSWGRSLRD